MEIISISVKVLDTLAKRVEDIEEKAEKLYQRQEDLGLKKWLDNQDVCEILDITKRTLQSYREKGLLPYSRIEHKIRYKQEDVQKLLQSSAHQSKKM
jgi:DNA-binding transcriptional MerR regulator